MLYSQNKFRLHLNDGRKSDGCHCKATRLRRNTADAVSVYTQLKMKDAPKLMKIPKSACLVDKEWEKLEKIPAWDKTKVRSKSEVIDEARTKGAKVHFASPMDICHLKNAELETKHQKYKGRVVLRGDIVKDDSGSYAAFTEQGSSASQMTAAKVMDVISRLPGCAGQAADAVSAYTEVKNGGCTQIIEKSQISMSRHFDSSTTTQKA